MSDRYVQCDDTCTVDCGACKGQGRPMTAADRPTGTGQDVRERLDELERLLAEAPTILMDDTAELINAVPALLAAVRAALDLADALDRDAAQDEDEGWAAGQRYSAGLLRTRLAAALSGRAHTGEGRGELA